MEAKELLEKYNTGERDFSEANLSGADLSGANLDFSCWPLWCGSKNVNVDMRIIYQLLAHVAVLNCDDPEFATIRELIMPYAQKCHRAKELELYKHD